MAQNATSGKKDKDANSPAFASITASDVIRAPVTQRSVPLHLLPLIKPYKKSGKLCLKVEQLPRGVTLSAGERDEDGAWVLQPEELENLTCLVPSNAVPRELTIRIATAGNGKHSTLKVLQYPLAAPETAPEPAQDTFITRSTKAQDPILRSQLGEMHSIFAVRESEVAEMRTALQRADQDKAAELEKARAAWALELDQRVAEAVSKAQRDGEPERDASREKQLRQEIAELQARTEQKYAADRELWQAQADQHIEAERRKWQAQADTLAAAQIERARGTWRAEQDVRTAALEAAAAQRLAEARDKFQGESREAAAKAEATWKSKEAERLAASEAAWREQLDRMLADGTARSGSLQSDLAAEQQARIDLARSAAVTEQELAELRDELAETNAAKSQGETRLRQEEAAIAKAEATWKQEAAARQTAADRELAGLREELARAQGARTQGEASARQDGEAALAKAEAVWKIREAERLAAAQTAWREQLDRTLADARTQSAAVQSDLAQEKKARADLALSAAATERALAVLREQLAQAHDAGTLGETRERQNGEAALAKAEAAWKQEAAARHATHERDVAGLRDELAQAHTAWTLAEARVREECQTAIAKAEAVWKLEEATQRVAKERELAGLRDELAKARAAGTLGETRVRQDGEATLAKAQAAWKLEEEARHAAAELRWQGRLDAALADAKTLGAGEDAHLARELLAARACLIERDEQLAGLRQELEQARRKTEDVAAQARTISAADEAARLATAEARGREQSAAALAEALARCEQAEAALTVARQEILDQDQDDANSERLRRELAAMQALLVNREAELTHARSAQTQNYGRQWPDPNLLVGRDFDDVEGFSIRRQKKPQLLFEALALAAVAIVLVLFWPRLETYFGLSSHNDDGVARVAAAPAPAVSAPAPAPAPAQETALVSKGVNMRASASSTGLVVARLARGAEVKVIERRGGWTLVGIDNAGRTQQGWVFSTYLKGAEAAAPEPVKDSEPAATARTAAAKAEPAPAQSVSEKPAAAEPVAAQPTVSEPEPPPPVPPAPAAAQASAPAPDPAPAPAPAPTPAEAPAGP